MSKRSTILISCLIALVAIPAIGIYFLEKHTEDTIKQNLEQHNIQVKNVHFSFIKDKLEIQGLSGSIPYAPEGSFSAASITAINPQLEAFSTQTQGHPLVADEVIINDLQTQYTAQQTHYSTQNKSLRILGWKQNVGKVLEAAAQKDLAAYMAAFMDMYVAQLQVTHGISTVKTAQWQNSISVESYTVQDLNPKNIASMEIFGIASQTTMNDQKEKQHTHVEKVQMGPLELPSPAFVTLLTEQAYFTPTPYEAKAEKLLLTHGREYFSTGLNSKIQLSGLSYAHEQANKKSPIFSLDNITLQAHYDALKDTSLRISTQLQGAQVNFEHISPDPQVRKIIQNMLGTQLIDVEASFATELLPTTQTSSVNASFGIKNLGEAKLGIQVILPLQKISQIFSGENTFNTLQKILLTLQLAGIQIHLQDQGLIPRAAISVSKQALISLEEAQVITVASIEKEIRYWKHRVSNTNYANLQQCMEYPGTLKITLAPAEPMALLPIYLMAQNMTTPLPLTITCKPGLPLVEAAKKILPTLQ